MNLALEELEEVATFFRDILGAEIGPEMTELSQYGHRAKGAWLGEEKPMRMELAEATDETLPIGKQIKRLRPGLEGLTFEVENIDEAIAELRAKGIRVSDKIEFHWPQFEYMYEAMIHPKCQPFPFHIELIERKTKPGMENMIY